MAGGVSVGIIEAQVKFERLNVTPGGGRYVKEKVTILVNRMDEILARCGGILREENLTAKFIEVVKSIIRPMGTTDCVTFNLELFEAQKKITLTYQLPGEKLTSRDLFFNEIMHHQ